MKASGILETVLYAENLDKVRPFYEALLGLECFQATDDRHLFFYCGDQVLLIFNPAKTSVARVPAPGVPPAHGARGAGHVCFRAEAAELSRWREIWRMPVSRSRRISNGRAAGDRSMCAIRPAIRSNSPSRESGTCRGKRGHCAGAKLVVASHNRGKLKEIDDLLAAVWRRNRHGGRSRIAGTGRDRDDV